MFAGRTIHLCVCGGIAAYKAAELVRRFQKAGAIVRVAMTDSAQQFVGQLTFQSLTRHPVLTKTLDATEEMEMGHITFAQHADAIVVAPATANMIAKAALGMGDGVVSTILLAANIPIIMAPAMNRVMYAQPAVQTNLETLVARGVHIVQPESGELACGDVGPGRLADYDDILESVHRVISRDEPLRGRRIVVSAGPTREFLDPVRFLSNPSSGRMGVAVARATRGGCTGHSRPWPASSPGACRHPCGPSCFSRRHEDGYADRIRREWMRSLCRQRSPTGRRRPPRDPNRRKAIRG